MSDEDRDPQENDLATSLARLPREIRFILDKAPAGICYIDHAQIYRYANERYNAYWGRPVVGMNIRETTGDAIYAEIRAAIERALSGQVSTHETEVQTPEGKRNYSAVMVPDRENGAVRGYVTRVDTSAGTISVTEVTEPDQKSDDDIVVAA